MKRRKRGHRGRRLKKREQYNSDVCGSISDISEACASITVTKNQKKRNSQPSKFYFNLGLSDDQIYYHFLSNYILDQNTLRSLGFPLESQLSPGKAWVFQDPEFRGGSNFVFDDEIGSNSKSGLDANAREFVPKHSILEDLDTASACSGDEICSKFESSPNSSSNSLSASAKEFIPSKSYTSLDGSSESFGSAQEDIYQPRNCARCNTLFYVFKNTGECVQKEDCLYHWGKARSSRKYSCCGKRSKTGCEKAPCHVWRGILYEMSGQHKDLSGFARTRVPRNRAQPCDGNYGVYGIDGEMLFTTNGLQLCKITVVGIDGRLVYETIVKPEDPIVDYNTRFSGVSSVEIGKGPAKTLKDVQNDLLGFINANTILIGHGLENDLRALKLVHMTIIDTSLVFPHYYGMPFRRSLKSLVQSYLKREIQAEKCGHDSYEDARSCIELMLWKMQQDLCQQPSSKTSISDSGSSPNSSQQNQYSSFSTSSPKSATNS